MSETLTAPEFSRVPDTPASYDYSALEALRERLQQLDYRYDPVQLLLGERAADAMARDQVVPGLWRIDQLLSDESLSESDHTLALAIGFFLLARTLNRAEVEALFDYAREAAGTIGLIEEFTADSGETLYRAAYDLRPHAANDGTELWVSSDLGAHQRPGVLRKDHVLGIGHASLTLAQITERTSVERALDLGTGCGIQTFHLLDHCQHVTATDISERALAFTRFNLLLNAPALNIDPQNLEARVSLRLGSLLEPVAGEYFDLVISNPPFVITPRRKNESAEDQFTYRDGGMPGDQLVSTLIEAIPSVLVPGGRAQMLGNWEIVGDSPWDERPRAWVKAAGAEAWFIQREVLTPESYAETWLKDASENRDRAAYESTYLDYLNDFASRKVSGIGFGMIWLRRPAENAPDHSLLQRYEEITYPIAQPIAASLTQAVARHDRLHAMTPQEFLDSYLVLAEDVTEERHGEPGAEHPQIILLRAGSGLCRTQMLSTEAAGFVSASDGELAVGQILNALTAILSWDVLDDRTREAVDSVVHSAANFTGSVLDADMAPERALLLEAIAELVEKSFLHFADEDTAQQGAEA